MIRYIVWAIILYLLIRFVFNFLIPVIRASNRMKAQMRDFQNKMNEQHQFQDNHTQFTGASQKGAQKQQSKAKAGDYIDFEEIK